jgi:hypothetical protein
MPSLSFRNRDPKIYQEWLHVVHNPYKKIKLFTTQFLEEYFTHWPWWYVFVVIVLFFLKSLQWVPVSIIAFSLSLQYNNMNIKESLLFYFLGMFSWTFAEVIDNISINY